MSRGMHRHAFAPSPTPQLPDKLAFFFACRTIMRRRFEPMSVVVRLCDQTDRSLRSCISKPNSVIT